MQSPWPYRAPSPPEENHGSPAELPTKTTVSGDETFTPPDRALHSTIKLGMTAMLRDSQIPTVIV